MSKLSDEEFDARAKVLDTIDEAVMRADTLVNSFETRAYFSVLEHAWFNQIVESFNIWHDTVLNRLAREGDKET